ncbi:hypothetical protein GCM10008018_30820 [Paenibacillus marchantiophytorum]|uniref:SLH domain-containing protein n=1 Tax=Paenibacillus marchantiophytorum TaxID=1619310 RepID=A0ABQ1EQN8_9BACL|nr:S-layer homology domain-containing protein [Paenibacillus marchantiophytorum]GFZ82787.1 hypothetical protein GCM10008018_30820 [Paenibacillus marchantiophytorum]
MKRTSSILTRMLVCCILIFSALGVPLAEADELHATNESISFVYNPSNGMLTGYVLSKNPDEISVYANYGTGDSARTDVFKQSDYIEVFGYANQNQKYFKAGFSIRTAEQPTKMTVKKDGENHEMMPVLKNGYSFYKYAQDIQLAAFRIEASQYVSAYSSDQFIPGSSRLFSFVPEAAGIDGLHVQFLQKQTVRAAVYMSNLAVTDFELMDASGSGTIGIRSVSSAQQINVASGGYEDLAGSLQLQLAEPLKQGHRYELRMTSTAVGNEIKLPTAGNGYNAAILLGKWYSYNDQLAGGTEFHSIAVSNAAYFDNLTLQAVTAPTQQDAQQSSTAGGETGKLMVDSMQFISDLQRLKTSGSNLLPLKVSSKDGKATVVIPADALREGQKVLPVAVLDIQSDMGSYQLPLRVIDLEKLHKQLGSDVSKMLVSVKFASVIGNEAALFHKKINELGAESIGEIIAYSVTVEANGQLIPLSDFQGNYVSRSMKLNGFVSGARATAVLFDPDTGIISFVPSVFEPSASSTDVVMKRDGNSIYSVVRYDKTFDDIQGNSAQNDIELLSSKLIVFGTSAREFMPEKQLTRAEFTTMLVRAMGWAGESSTEQETHFADVSTGDWYAEAVALAARKGLIGGYPDGTFHPHEMLSKEQMVVMLIRAWKAAGGKAISMEESASEIAYKYADYNSVSSWAKPSIAAAINVKLISSSDTMFDSASVPTRAVAVTYLKTFLQLVGFIN